MITNYYDVPGLYYYPDYLESHDEVLEFVSSLSFENNNTCHLPQDNIYSKYYNTDNNILDKLFSLVEVDITASFPIPVSELTYVVLNKFLPNDGFDFHNDSKCFSGIVGISLGAPSKMRFRRDYGDTIKACIKSVKLEPGSLYVMTGECFEYWEHSIYNRTNDVRYSIIYSQ